MYLCPINFIIFIIREIPFHFMPPQSVMTMTEISEAALICMLCLLLLIWGCCNSFKGVYQLYSSIQCHNWVYIGNDMYDSY